MLLATTKNGGGRGKFLWENPQRATHHGLLQFRYIYLIKPSWHLHPEEDLGTLQLGHDYALRALGSGASGGGGEVESTSWGG